ncbi:MAG: anthranilate phosphoribosyltransferase [Lachnospiraceae bacterium]|nr:anthranilate phosphoribosyltransferase [Lachnospiraceae bacterium]
MIRDSIGKVVNGENLSLEETKEVMSEIMSGDAAPTQVSSFLTAMHLKGETVDEITACADVMRNFALKVEHENDVLEIVGTGGDKANSFNISTLSAIVTSAAGIAVAKHGNRAASSKCGTADCLEALGVKLAVEPERNAEILKETNLCFMFAQKYHSAMKYVGPVRKDIGIPTIFNILGPLTNPAFNNLQLLGVYKEELLEPLANVLYNLGIKKAMVVYGQDCLDEISMSAPTSVCEMIDGEITKYTIEPEQFGFERCAKDDLVGGSPEENAKIALDILNGEKGPKRDAVLLNAGAAIHIAKGVSIEEGIKIAAEAIDSGKALAQLNSFVEATNRE